MIAVPTVIEFEAPPLRKGEILRYSNGDPADEGTDELIDVCASELLPTLTYRVCYGEFPVVVSGESVSICGSTTVSRDLSKYLLGCDRAIVFGATVGLSPDRHIKKYSRISPARALIYSAIGSERTEALCDAFCKYAAEEYGKTGYRLSPRFSAGYGDLSLDLQRPIFDALDLSRRLGISLGSTMLMTPTKSVTAIIAVRPKNIRS